MAGHYSPTPDESHTLEKGDIVKIELGAHIDGYLANAAHTVVIGGEATGRNADTVLAAWNAFQAALRTFRVGGTNQEVTQVIQRVCEQYEVEPLQGVLSHKVKKHLNDGNETIINKETPEQRVDDYEFAPGDVFSFDVYVSSGEGIARELDVRTTVYKRELEQMYNLKSKHARAFFNQVNQTYPTLPFSISGFENLSGARVGVKECMEHDLLIDYPVLGEKPGEVIARFGATVVVAAKAIQVIAGKRQFNVEGINSEHQIKDQELNDIISRNLWVREKKAKK